MANNNKLTEDSVALFIGCFVFILAALNLWGVDVLGWVLKTNMWTNMSDAFSVTNKGYANISGIGSLLLTWAGIANLVNNCIDLSRTRNIIIVSLTLTVGIGGAVFTWGEFSLSGIGLAALVGVLLNLILPRND